MISYLFFILKKMLKNKLNVFLIIFIPIILILVMYFNINNNNNDYMKQSLDKVGYEKNFKQSYSNLLNKNKIEIQKTSSTYLSQELLDNNSFLKYLKDNNLKYESNGSQIKAYQFVQQNNNDYIMLLLLLIITFISVDIMSSNFIESININQILPKNEYTKDILNIFFISTLYFSLWLINNIIAFIIGTIFGGTGQINYPIKVFIKNFQAGEYYDPSKLFGKTIIIQILFILFISSFEYLIIKITKEKILSLFSNIILIFGTLGLIFFFPPATKIANNIPFAFFNGKDISTLTLGNNINNISLNYTQGIRILSLYIIIIFLILIFRNIHKKEIIRNKIM